MASSSSSSTFSSYPVSNYPMNDILRNLQEMKSSIDNLANNLKMPPVDRAVLFDTAEKARAKANDILKKYKDSSASKILDATISSSLNGTLGALHTLKNYIPSARYATSFGEYRSWLTSAQNWSDKVIALISGKQESISDNKTHFSLKTLLNAIHSKYTQPAFNPRTVKFAPLIFPEDLPDAIFGCEETIKSIIDNLHSNAVKYAKNTEPVKVTIKLTKTDLDVLICEVSCSNALVRPLTQDEDNNIFQMFSRVKYTSESEKSEATGSNPKGVGLTVSEGIGLSTSRQDALDLGGYLTKKVDNNTDHSTITFTFAFPYESPKSTKKRKKEVFVQEEPLPSGENDDRKTPVDAKLLEEVSTMRLRENSPEARWSPILPTDSITSNSTTPSGGEFKTAPKKNKKLETLHVCIFEDSAMSILIIKRILKNALTKHLTPEQQKNYNIDDHITVIKSLEDAENFLNGKGANLPFDFVLMDNHLSEHVFSEDGINLATKICAMEKTLGCDPVPVYLTSADAEVSKPSVVCGNIGKPITFDNIEKALLAHFEEPLSL